MDIDISLIWMHSAALFRVMSPAFILQELSNGQFASQIGRDQVFAAGHLSPSDFLMSRF
jgi:hypothetical protein